LACVYFRFEFFDVMFDKFRDAVFVLPPSEFVQHCLSHSFYAQPKDSIFFARGHFFFPFRNLLPLSALLNSHATF
jgi:hypothetical protein